MGKGGFCVVSLPLEKRLKKRLHLEVARLQDELVELSYSLDNSLVLHGGTAIWRCFGGNRFSEDLNFYCGKAEKIREGFADAVRETGFELRKFKETGSLFFAKVWNGEAEVRVEINFGAGKKGGAV